VSTSLMKKTKQKSLPKIIFVLGNNRNLFCYNPCSAICLYLFRLILFFFLKILFLSPIIFVSEFVVPKLRIRRYNNIMSIFFLYTSYYYFFITCVGVCVCVCFVQQYIYRLNPPSNLNHLISF